MFNFLCHGTIFVFLCLGHPHRTSFLVHEKSKSSFKVKSNQDPKHFLHSSMFKKQKTSLLSTMSPLVSRLHSVRRTSTLKPITISVQVLKTSQHFNSDEKYQRHWPPILNMDKKIKNINLGGSSNLKGNHLTIICFDGRDFKADDWAVFSGEFSK